MKNFLTMLLSLIIALLIVVFTDFAEGETFLGNVAQYGLRP